MYDKCVELLKWMGFSEEGDTFVMEKNARD
jgi:hypothetical protein